MNWMELIIGIGIGIALMVWVTAFIVAAAFVQRDEARQDRNRAEAERDAALRCPEKVERPDAVAAGRMDQFRNGWG